MILGLTVKTISIREWEHCQDLCRRHQTCQGWTFATKLNSCLIKNYGFNSPYRAESIGHVSGPRNCNGEKNLLRLNSMLIYPKRKFWTKELERG